MQARMSMHAPCISCNTGSWGRSIRDMSSDIKGTGLTKEVFRVLRESSLNFRGNIEGHDLFEDPVEVVLCDGFVGNVVLKTCEAIAHAIFTWLKHELKKNPKRLIGASLAKGA